MRVPLKPALLLLLAALTVAAVGTFLRLDAAARQTAGRKASAPKGGRFVSAGDCELFIQERGDAGEDDPVMIFVGDAGEWSETWRPWAKMAADHNFHAVAVDLPPFGYSTPPTGGYSRGEQAARLVKLAEKLEARAVVFVAHGIGAGPAITAAGNMPDKTVSVLLITPELDPELTLPVSGFFLKNDFTRFAIAALATNPKLQRYFLEKEVHREAAVTAEAVEIRSRPLNLQGTSEERSRWLARAAGPIPDSVFRIPAFVTIFSADQDSLAFEARQIGALVSPPTDLRELKGVGHVPQLEDPQQFSAAFGGYLAGLFDLMAPVEPTEP